MNKPLDKLFEKMDSAKDKFFKDMDKALPKEVTYVSRLESEVKQLKHIAKGYRFETATLKEEIIDLKERIKDDDDLYEIYQDLKQENATLKKSLSKSENLIEELKDIPLVEFKTENFSLEKKIEKLKLKLFWKEKGLKKADEAFSGLMQDYNNLERKYNLCKKQLRAFGKVFDDYGGKEVDAEFNEEEFNNNKKGESDHE